MKVKQNFSVIDLKCHQQVNATKSEMSLKHKCYQNWNVAKTEASPKLKFHHN